MTSSISGVAGNAALQTPAKASSDPNSPANEKNLFLTMMIAQMKNQDPTSPMDANSMVTQMSQLTEVEQTSNMAATMTSQTNIGMIGKAVDFTDTTGATQTGLVAGVTSVSGSSQLVIDGVNGSQYTVDPTEILDVADGSVLTGTSTATPGGSGSSGASGT